MSGERFLITGAFGCIGTWVVRELVREGVAVTAFDLDTEPHRWRLVMSDQEISQVRRVQGDITDLGQLEIVLDGDGITHVIHLAALQVPFCRADPPLGARVNVVGTVNVFEAVKRRADRIAAIAYASSIAAYDALEDGRDTVEMTGQPGTLYGVYKRANEGTAHVYWADDGVASIGLRPHTVFGPGRDQGLTSAPTTAMLAAAAGMSYRIPFGGRIQFQYAPDAARAFIAAARADATGATVHNLAGTSVHMGEVVAAIAAAAPDSAGRIAFDDVLLPFPGTVDAASFERLVGPVIETPLLEAVADTVARFRDLIGRGLVDPIHVVG
ncbi:MAG TPA: NAD-dependent epimerase/dehydratase family protein [Gaiellales bacterium]|nr:NAD-dependent epimerase/dehydratase family protein [Gaiellales bacterium]